MLSMDTNCSVRSRVRRLGCRDLSAIVRVVRQTQAQPWRGWEFLACVRASEIVGCVAEVRGQLVGFALCTPVRARESTPRGRLESFRDFCRRLMGRHQIGPVCVNLLDVVVAGEWSRSPAERALLEQMDHELRLSGDLVRVIVPETKLRVQLFLHEAGYQATRVLHGHFGDEDGYIMEYCAGHRTRNDGDKKANSAAPAPVETSQP
jgi:hypothetical protein